MTLDSNGLLTDRPSSITTWTGRRVEPLNMRAEDVDIEDIAHSLARQCRYNGHVEGYYSVARHSILVSEALDGTGYELAGLLHDAAEAYLGDVVRPLKQSAAFSMFREADQRLDELIAKVAGLPYPQPREVFEADRHLLVDLELPDGGLRYTRDSTPDQDERDFLVRYRELTATSVGLSRVVRLVGMAGYAQSGKDTSARVLTEFFRFERVAFADTLRDMLYAINPWGANNHSVSARVQEIVDSIGWERAKTEYPEVRELLQRLGTEAGRGVIGDTVWVDTAMRKVKPGGRYVFTDVRFPNEFDAIKAAGGEVWRINRPGTEPVGAHPSETALDQHAFDRLIGNNGSLLELDRAVHQAAGQMFRLVGGKLAST